PITKDGLKAIRTLAAEGIMTNATLCFNVLQALFVARAGATFVSPFVGRLDDRGHNGMEVISQIRTVYTNYHFKTEIIVASIRHPLHVVDAAMMGADISTIPFGVFEKLIQHPLTDLGIQAFLDDYKKIPK
ncbi:MAG: transaldolase family protein, partial [Planctomycetota bacterium]|nr:transaldolase family protein [Planctomycetota bacterium]